ncbi:MAG TPA: ribosome-binding factor A [Candidatus Paceibacterota bacterium]|nr:ribosome-binding factor A [Candidatus Paceibacterota bacterium]
MTHRQGRFESLVSSLAAKYIEKNIEGALVTVTNIFLPSDLKKVIIYTSILPEEKESEILALLQEKKEGLRRFLGEEIKTRFVPEVEIEIDPGRKTRELIDQLS